MSARRAACALVLATVAFSSPAASAAAADATLAEVRALAARAPTEPAALEQLRRLDSVDGRPVDLGSALAGDEAQVEERLETLAGRAPAPPVDPAAARRDAGEILAERRFREVDAPRPFRGLLEWLGEKLEGLYDRLAERLPGGEAAVWTLLAALVVLGAVLVGGGLARRRGRRFADAAPTRPARARPDPHDLERRADDAERRGELEEALRLQFRAGLARLERARAIPFRYSMTSGEIASRLGSRDFERLAGTFDEVVYGRRPPEPGDVRSSREGWRKVLQEAAAR